MNKLNKTINKTLGERLKELRKENNMIQREIFEHAGIDQSYYSRMENDNMTGVPSEKVIKSIADKLGHFDELMLLAGRIPTDIKTKIVNADLELLEIIRKY